MRIIRLLSAASAVALAIGLAACGGGGGGGGSSLPTTGGQAPVNGEAATAQFTINIPARSSQGFKRHGQYISASTKSMTISTLSNNVATQAAEVDLTTASPNCSASGGALVCTVKYLSTAGSNTYQIDMFDAIGGKGNKLSTGNVAATLVAGQDTVVPLVLNGVPVTAAVVLGQSSLPVGYAGSVSVLVQARDSGGNLIIGPGDYSAPITLAVTGDKYGTVTLGTTSVTTPGQAVTLSYTGGSNLGSTITPSATGVTGTAATFSPTGSSVTALTNFDAVNRNYFYPYVVSAYSSATPKAAVMQEICVPGTCYYGITINSPTAQQKALLGGGYDPYSPNASPTPTAGLTIVPGMSNHLNDEEFEAYAGIAVDNLNGDVYYAASHYGVTDATGCAGLNQNSGSIGLLDPSTATLAFAEKPTMGFTGSIKVDSSGNAWFLEESGQCNGANLLGSDNYAIGKLTPTGTLTETKFSAIGLPNQFPGDIAITADGSILYVGFDSSSAKSVAEVNTATMTAITPFVTVTGSYDINAMATSTDDGTVAWFTDCDPGDSYFYGYAPGGTSFTTANMHEGPLPITDQYSYSGTYGDGSFWFAGDDDIPNGGWIRLTGLSTATPKINYYPGTGYYPEMTSVSYGGGGVMWATDDDDYSVQTLQYGVQGNGTVQSQAKHALGSSAAFPAPMQLHMPHHSKHPMHMHH